MQGIPVDSIEDIDPDRYQEMRELDWVFEKYTIFKMAQRIGAVYNINDIAVDELQYYYEIESQAGKVKAKDGK